MNRLRTRAGLRAAVSASVGLMIVLPLVAWFAAPDARADDSPGADLAGLNVNAYATAMQFIPLAKGLVPAGNLSTGDFFQISIPYSGASSQTGPASTAIGTPMYPGPVAIALPGALQTEGFPAQYASLFADPVLAQSAYPTEPGRGASASYPPGGSPTGAGTAKAGATAAGSTAQAATNDTPLAGGAIEIGSSTADSATTIGASTVSDVAHSYLSRISILNGLVQIASITSTTTATSNGSVGTETNSLRVGAVTVAGQPAYIGPDGLHLANTANGLGNLLGTFNSALSALQQAGITITTIAPNTTEQGASASVDSGAVQIQFLDPNIPNPQGEVPVNLIGADIDLGLTHSDAQATLLPALGSLPISIPPAVVSAPAPGGTVSSPVAATGSGSESVLSTGNVSSGPTTAGVASAPQAPVQQGLLPVPAATFIGMPTRMAWVVLAIIVSIIFSGPLLGYANWQLIKGRRT